MADPTLPPSLAAELADLKRRLNNLERSAKVPFSSMRGGLFILFDQDGNPRLELGELPLDGSINGVTSGYGTFMRGDGGGICVMMLDGDRGLVMPIVTLNVHEPTSRTVSSGTFASQYEALTHFPSHQVLYTEVPVHTDVGTTAEIKLRENFSGVETSALTIPSGSDGRASFEWLHPLSVGLYDDAVVSGNSLWLQVLARRASGAGLVSVFTPAPCDLTSKFLHPNAATNGNPALG